MPRLIGRDGPRALARAEGPRVPSEEMPEGDTIHYAANRIRPVLEGHVPDELATPHPRFGRDRWPERLAGRAVRSVDAHGKHLFLRFEGGLTIHSHLRMTGSWQVRRPRRAAGARSPRSAWLRIRRGDREVLQFNGPVLELMTDSRTRLDRRIAGLGPDILARELDEARRSCAACARTTRRARSATRCSTSARSPGIGNLWKVEGCFAAGIDPWRPTGDGLRRGGAGDRPRDAPADAARPPPTASRTASRSIYGRAGRPCPRCGSRVIKVRGQWDDNRPTFWCPGCQA